MQKIMPMWLSKRVDPIELLFRIILGGVFFWGGINKIKDPQSFEIVVRSYQLLNDPWNAWLAISLPPLEIILGTCILLRLIFSGAVVASAVLLFAFILSLSSLLLRGIDIECGCLGLRLSLQIQLIIDVFLLLTAVFLYLSECRSTSTKKSKAQ